MKKKVVILTILAVNIAAAEIITGTNSNGSNSYILNCDNKNYDCILIAKNHTTGQRITFSQHIIGTSDSPSKWYGTDILDFTLGVGSGIIYSTFVNFNPFQMSIPFLNANYVNPDKEIAIVDDPKVDFQSLMVCLFNNKIQPKIVLKNGALDFSSFTSVGQNQLKFGYYDQNGNYAFKTINLNLNCFSSS